ncbi:hypothetical protein WA158_000981 [Blastocystis sp. Blastoise]
MAEEVANTTPVTEPVAEPAAVAAPVEEPLDTMSALKIVLKNAMFHDGLQRGLRVAVKALDRKAARLCCLADDCDEAAYKRLVQALCKDNSIPLIQVPESKTLGEWCGLCKIDAEGNARKVAKCSCCVITNFGEDCAALGVVLNYIKEHSN